MDVLQDFLQSEINTQGLYDEIISFINSYHIRSGEFEGNDYVIRKIDSINFILCAEYENPQGWKEIHGAIAIYKHVLISTINSCAKRKGLILSED